MANVLCGFGTKLAIPLRALCHVSEHILVLINLERQREPQPQGELSLVKT